MIERGSIPNFTDTSAFIKLFLQERGGAEMLRLRYTSAQGREQFFYSALTGIEARSVISRLRKGGRLSPDEAFRILAAIDVELADMTEQLLTSDVQALAAILVERHAMRSLDALQLASAIVTRDRNGPMLFVSADRRLNDLAHLEKFTIWNPED